MDVSIRTYGQYSSSNYGAHALRVNIGSLALWFSYETIVDFNNGNGARVSQNDWQSTTGKHLNWIDGGNEAKKARLPRAQFLKELNECLARHNLSEMQERE